MVMRSPSREACAMNGKRYLLDTNAIVAASAKNSSATLVTADHRLANDASGWVVFPINSLTVSVSP